MLPDKTPFSRGKRNCSPCSATRLAGRNFRNWSPGIRQPAAGPRAGKASVITYILVFERERGLIHS